MEGRSLSVFYLPAAHASIKASQLKLNSGINLQKSSSVCVRAQTVFCLPRQPVWVVMKPHLI